VAGSARRCLVLASSCLVPQCALMFHRSLRNASASQTATPDKVRPDTGERQLRLQLISPNKSQGTARAMHLSPAVLAHLGPSRSGSKSKVGTNLTRGRARQGCSDAVREC
jgi:hypothetical protein